MQAFHLRRQLCSLFLTTCSLKMRGKGAPKKKRGPPGKPFAGFRRKNKADHVLRRREKQEEVELCLHFATSSRYVTVLPMNVGSSNTRIDSTSLNFQPIHIDKCSYTRYSERVDKILSFYFVLFGTWYIVILGVVVDAIRFQGGMHAKHGPGLSRCKHYPIRTCRCAGKSEGWPATLFEQGIAGKDLAKTTVAFVEETWPKWNTLFEIMISMG